MVEHTQSTPPFSFGHPQHSVIPRITSHDATNGLKIEVVAERRGSYEIVLVFILGAAAGGVIGNRADAAIVWVFRGLIDWYRKSVSTYMETKGFTTDYTEIAAALERMASEEGVSLTEQVGESHDEVWFEIEDAADRQDVPSLPKADAGVEKSQILVERLDQALKQATQPLKQSCESVTVSTSKSDVLFRIGPVELSVITSPLTAPMPTRDWQNARIKFERINRKTGKALFYFDGDDDGGAAHYSHIIDPEVRKAPNRYTQAFNSDELLDVWVRQTHPEKGRLNLQWEITSHHPAAGTLFN